MSSSDWHQLFPHTADANSGDGSFDVLLQLTFPIVLILAFVALVLRQELREVQTTPVAEMQRQIEALVIELQRQILTKAADETLDVEARESGLDDYQALQPTPEAVVAEQLDEKYRAMSFRLYGRFNRPERVLVPELRERALERYRAIAGSYPSLAGRGISLTNRAHLEASLTGGVDKLLDRMVASQQTLVSEWIRSAVASAATRTQSREWWTRFVKQPSELEEAGFRDRFTNVKLEFLRDRMIRLRAPLLDRTLQGVL